MVQQFRLSVIHQGTNCKEYYKYDQPANSDCVTGDATAHEVLYDGWFSGFPKRESWPELNVLMRFLLLKASPGVLKLLCFLDMKPTKELAASTTI